MFIIIASGNNTFAFFLVNFDFSTESTVASWDHLSLSDLQARCRTLENELNETRSLLTVNQLHTENVLETERRKCREELASIERIMNERLREYKTQYQTEVDRWKAQTERLETKLKSDLRVESTNEKQLETKELKSESMLSAVTKTFRQKVNSLTTIPNAMAVVADERSKHASDDSDLLLPYEQEVQALKDKLRLTDQRVQSYEAVLLAVMRNFGKEPVLNSIHESGDKGELDQLNEKFDSKDDSKSLISNISDDFGLDAPESMSLISQLICENSAIHIQNERLAKEIEELNGFINNGAVGRSIVANDSSRRLIKRVSASSSDSSATGTSGRFLLQRARSLDLMHLGSDDVPTIAKCESVKSCSNCREIESKLKSLQDDRFSSKDTLSKVNDEVLIARNELKREQELRTLLEGKFATQAKELEDAIDNLRRGLNAKQQQLSQFRALLDQCVQHVQTQVGQVETDNRRLLIELQHLQRENQLLLGKHLARSDTLAREKINLPQRLEEAQEQCLRLREDLISLQVAKERIEETYKGQLAFIKEQQRAEQQEKESLEESLIQDNETVRNERDRAVGELQALQVRYEETETHLKECQEKIASLVKDYHKQVDSLESQVEQLTSTKVRFD